MRDRVLLRPLKSALAVGGLALVLVAAGCSSEDSEAAPETTTGTIPRLAPTSTQPRSPGGGSGSPESSSDFPVGLWLATAGGVTDEIGTRYATASGVQFLRDPLDDGAGGVVYLRCVEESANCAIERVTERGADPILLGEAADLLAVATVDDTPVLLTQWIDPARTADFETDTSDSIMRVINLDDAWIISTHEWFGWESGPFAADAEKGAVATCIGEGPSCSLQVSPGLDDEGLEVPTTPDGSTITLALSGDATTLVWLEAVPMGGPVSAHVRDLATGQSRVVPLREEDDPVVEEAVNDAEWAAVRYREVVEVVGLLPDAPSKRFTVPESITDIALRPLGGGGGSATSPL